MLSSKQGTVELGGVGTLLPLEGPLTFPLYNCIEGSHNWVGGGDPDPLREDLPGDQAQGRPIAEPQERWDGECCCT